MKIVRLSLVVSLLLPIIPFIGCKKYLDINSDPVNPQESSAELVIAPIVANMAIGTALDYRQLFKTIQYWGSQSSSDTWERHGYVDASDLGGYIWRMTYADLGLNLEDMIDDGISNQKYEYAGIGYAIKAWAYQIATDLHGPIILDAAFDPTLLSFPYQDQDTVYRKIRTWCQLALTYLDMESPVDYSSQLNSVSGDNVYRGDLAKWKQFVYGLMALQFSHLVNKSEFQSQYADSVIRYVDSSFASDSDDPMVLFTASNSSDGNPFGPTYGMITGTTYGEIASPILGLLTGGVRGTAAEEPKESVDPRLTRMLTYTPADSIYRAVTPTYGDVNSDVPHVLGATNSSGIYTGKYLFGDATSYPLMSYAQLQFAKSEAYYYKGNLSEAYNAYLNGIRAHMNFINLYGLTAGGDASITSSEIEAYLASSEVPQSSDSLTIADIMQQKFIAQWGWAGMEQWCDLRKYHYDAEIFRTFYQLSSDELADQNNGSYAYRYRPRYNSEYVWNSAELDKWGGLATDYMTYETWFSLP
ncbi:MAG: SusD/RagB family nutrient-binding outer membrane lipoprotein [Niabella sp.]